LLFFFERVEADATGAPATAGIDACVIEGGDGDGPVSMATMWLSFWCGSVAMTT
jgi:hypothetical protein